MDIYRMLSREQDHWECHSHRALSRIYQKVQPSMPSKDGLPLLEKCLEYESKIFFPDEDVRNVITPETAKEILECNCKFCLPKRPRNGFDIHEMLDRLEDRKILLAILVFLDQAPLLATICKGSEVTDNNLDAVTRVKTLPEGFHRNYRTAIHLFQPLRFKLPLQSKVLDSQYRLPFYEESDKPFAVGQFGEIRKFQIHPNYLDDSITAKLRDYNMGTKPWFARKTLRRTYSASTDPTSSSTYEMERDVLNLVNRQQDKNIIDVIAFYVHHGATNFVFPFVENNLQDILTEKRRLDRHSTSTDFPHHWLWEGMIGVASGLRTIHHPPVQIDTNRGYMAGFHLDLKPDNILVTNEGLFKITDFGQSTITMTKSPQYGYSYYRGGDFVYQAPEACPSLEDIKKAVYATEDQGIHITSKYDVWSLGCIFLEVLIFIFEGKSALEDFVQNRRAEDAIHPGYYDSDKCLKSTVFEKCASLRSSTAFGKNLVPAQVCLNETLELVKGMLSVKPPNRPSSTEVYQRLEAVVKEFDLSRSPQDEMLVFMNGLETPDDFEEIGWGGEGRPFSFYELNDIKIQSVRGDVPSPGFVQCRIKIYCHKDGQKLIIRRAYKSTLGTLQNLDDNLLHGTASYAPVYIYDPSRPTTCAVLNTLYPAIYTFATQKDLILFQAVVTRHHMISEGDGMLNTIHLERKLALKFRKPPPQDVKCSSVVAVQLWRQAKLKSLVIERKQSILTTQSGDSDLSSSSGTGKRPGVSLVVFTKDTDMFLAIPLQDRSKVLKEGQHNAAVVKDSKHLSIEVAKERQFKDFGIALSSGTWDDGSSYTTPRIRTDVIQNSEFPQTLYYAEIEFGNHDELMSIRSILEGLVAEKMIFPETIGWKIRQQRDLRQR